jgi:hypothetical protein
VALARRAAADLAELPRTVGERSANA